MKNNAVFSLIFGLCLLFIFPKNLSAQALPESYDLSGKRTAEPQFFFMESQLHSFEADGTNIGTDIFRLKLKYVPSGEKEVYTCVLFTVQLHGNPERSIPALKNWSYEFAADGYDDKGQVFGIDHSKFENIVDAEGQSMPPDKVYHVYNAFIDFHGASNVFTDPSPEGNGVQDLKQIGDKIVHYAANSQPPVNLGSNIMEGSYFKNGEITLELKGLSSVNDRDCALIGYDSGASSFKMLIEAMPGMEVETLGSSHYFGDIYKDLENNWLQKATLGEFVLSQTTVPMMPDKINGIMERSILIRNVSEKEFGPQ